MASTSPIAVLDTGAGGLSVVKALRRLLPHEEIQYFADTAHLPYGIKSPELIKYLAVRMAKRLYELSSCKILIIACHTISTWSLLEIKEALKIPVIGMLAPSIQGLTELVLLNQSWSSIGVLSTQATVSSKAYREAWPIIDPQGRVTLLEHAAGPLVSLVEEADIQWSSLKMVVDHFLPESIKKSDAVLIGCTHFSALVPIFREVLKPGCHIVDAADLAARMVVDQLDGLPKSSTSQCSRRVIAYVSDNPQRFQIIARRFIEEDLVIEWLRDYARS